MNISQRKAISIAKRVFNLLKVKPGQRETEVASHIKALLKKFGARPAFRVIVASGKRSALPHGFATNKIIKQGELVVIDFGALYNGYRSDMTRTYVIGKPTARQKKIYQIVQKAQAKALKAVRAGRRCSEVDQAARGYIEEKGLGKFFVHSTGHGVGRKVHQPPKISRKNRRRLRLGTIICIEPGIYIKGFGGVRIEDMVIVTKTGCRVLTR
ncbi:MAG: aminopeptidase P family protein [Candidatus Margulisbacteria bacterium]|nr:aminopeptidase P family protein [Candidatus Margulisiibacteriota bacterium]